MSIGGSYNTVTSYEIRAIETFLSGKVISLSTASRRLKEEFEVEAVNSPNSPPGFYNASTQAERVYEYYKIRYNVQVEVKKLMDYEQLKHDAISYCEKHDVFLKG